MISSVAHCLPSSIAVEWRISPGLVDYETAVAEMEARVEAIIAGTAPEMVWLLEHPPLYTSGTSAKASDLLHAQFPVYKTGRGGEFTYHGPGQRVAYVMLDLAKRNCQDLKLYVAKLENWLVQSIEEFGVNGFRREGRIGVWVSCPPSTYAKASADMQGWGSMEKKIAAIGIRVRKWVSFHGVCLNVHPDLSHYSGIVPCGIKEYGVTSLEEMGVRVTMKEVDAVLRAKFQETMF